MTSLSSLRECHFLAVTYHHLDYNDNDDGIVTRQRKALDDSGRTTNILCFTLATNVLQNPAKLQSSFRQGSLLK